jgi:hypothetical protein
VAVAVYDGGVAMSEAARSPYVQISDDVRELRGRLKELDNYLETLEKGRLVGREQSAASVSAENALEIFDMAEKFAQGVLKVIEQGKEKVRKQIQEVGEQGP